MAWYRGSATTAVFAFLTGWVLWPPEWPYWMVVAPMLGDSGTVAVVFGLAVGLGIGFAAITLFPLGAMAVGGLTGYLAGMLAITYVVSPDGWFTYAWYGVLLVCFLGGTSICHLHTGRLRLPRVLDRT
jgi:hypothetical protein